MFKDMFRHDSCHHQFNVLFRFPLFYIRLQFDYVNNLKFKIQTEDGVFDDFPKISDHFPKISENFPKLI